jgi:lathosterol oxidase
MNWSKYFFYIEKIGIRYFVIAGLAFAIFYILLKKKISNKKIQKKIPRNKDYAREIGYSIVTIAIFAFVPLIILHSPNISAHTFFYTDIKKNGWLYFFLVFPLMLIVHDTYFYWMHRLMHHKKLFTIFHLVHHHSTNPSPWAAYAFHPLEAIVEAGIFAVFLFTIPITPYHLGIFFFLMIVYNVYGHLGYELYPKGFNKNRVGKWINTSVNHNQHHQYFKGNYGLYFLWWDRWMKTIRTDYDEKFEAVKTIQKERA